MNLTLTPTNSKKTKIDPLIKKITMPIVTKNTPLDKVKGYSLVTDIGNIKGKALGEISLNET